MIGLPRFGILPTKQKSSPTKTERGIRLGRFCGALPLLRLIALVNSPTQLGFAANKHKSFLRSPLEFTRISSGFSLGRFHSVLQTMRAHKGVDMAAPSGTRIKASGDAVVDFVGQKGGYGNVITLKHANGISTVYGHLSRFAAGLHRGEKVAQGDIIGFVGMTGLATGPHLHYEFLLNGQQHDPMKVALPKADPIASRDKAKFDSASDLLTAQLRLLGSSNIAALE